MKDGMDTQTDLPLDGNTLTNMTSAVSAVASALTEQVLTPAQAGLVLDSVRVLLGLPGRAV